MAMQNAQLSKIQGILISFLVLYSAFPISAFAESAITPAPDNKQSTNAASKDNTGKANDKNIGKKSQSLGFFNTVNLSGIGNLYIKQSDKPDFTVEADNSILPLVIVYVKDKTLYIDLKNSTEHSEATINYYLNVKDLKSINSSSSATIYIQDTFKTKELDLSIGNFGEAIINLYVTKFVATMEGGGKITANGFAEQQSLTISGAGEYHGEKLKGKEIMLSISGSGTATTGPSDKLNVKSNGDAVIKYCGKPSITKDISGKGVITAADNC